jgi:D-glycero-D-manno-heptose 1,7-bisphosphate phosphatase
MPTAAGPAARPAVFMDRDGTLAHEVGYVNHVSRFRLFPWAVDSVRLLNRAGLLAVVVTNQAGVARGYFPESLIAEVHARMSAAMEAGGARLDGIYYCPHHPTAGEAPYRQDCDCRKPRPGLVRRAAKDLGIDLARSWVVGDRDADVALARSVGARAALVKTGYGRGELLWHAPAWPRPPELVAEHLLEAVERILADAEGAGSPA